MIIAAAGLGRSREPSSRIQTTLHVFGRGRRTDGHRGTIRKLPLAPSTPMVGQQDDVQWIVSDPNGANTFDGLPFASTDARMIFLRPPFQLKMSRSARWNPGRRSSQASVSSTL